MSDSGPYRLYQDGVWTEKPSASSEHITLQASTFPLSLNELIALIQQCVTEEVTKQLKQKETDKQTWVTVGTMTDNGPTYTTFKLTCGKCSYPQGCQCQDCKGAGYE